jgi:hypothetical protein
MLRSHHFADVSPPAALSMRESGIALNNPLDSRWSLAEGDELVRLKGGATEWAISVQLADNGGRDILTIAHLGIEGLKAAVAAGSAASVAMIYGKKVGAEIKKLSQIKDKANPLWQAREDLRRDCTDTAQARPMGLGLLGISNGDADDDGDHDPVNQRIAALVKPENKSLLTPTEIAITVRLWDKVPSFFGHGTFPASRGSLHHDASSRSTTIRERFQTTSAVYRHGKNGWRFLVPLPAADVVLNPEWRIAPGNDLLDHFLQLLLIDIFFV